MKPELHAQILTLRKYQAWRTGKDDRMLTEVGIIPPEVTTALNSVLDIVEKYLQESDSICCNIRLTVGSRVAI